MRLDNADAPWTAGLRQRGQERPRAADLRELGDIICSHALVMLTHVSATPRTDLFGLIPLSSLVFSTHSLSPCSPQPTCTGGVVTGIQDGFISA